MPRHADPDLESKILEVAQKLWTVGGDQALTMRAVAAAAGTTTPTVYQRFKDRQDILRGLLLRIRQDVMRVLNAASSPEDMCACYLQYGLSHPKEYELFFSHSDEVFGEEQRRSRSYQEGYPGRELARKKLAEWLGGTPEDHTDLHLALWAVMHGTVMLLISKTVHGGAAKVLRRNCDATVQLLLRESRKGEFGGSKVELSQFSR